MVPVRIAVLVVHDQYSNATTGTYVPVVSVLACMLVVPLQAVQPASSTAVALATASLTASGQRSKQLLMLTWMLSVNLDSAS